jgi:hypothetical protein
MPQKTNSDPSIVEVRYGLTINLGNYNSERIDVSAVVDEGDTPEEALGRCRKFIAEASPHGARLLAELDKHRASAAGLPVRHQATETPSRRPGH